LTEGVSISKMFMIAGVVMVIDMDLIVLMGVAMGMVLGVGIFNDDG
jgi:hypothetical protein